MVMHHTFDVQAFYGDEAIAIDKATGRLVNAVMPSITRTFMHAGANLTGFAPGTGPFGETRHLPFGFRQRLLFLEEEARIGNLASIGEGSEVSQPHIDTCLFRRGWKRFDEDFAGEAGIPLAAPPADGKGLHFSL